MVTIMVTDVNEGAESDGQATRAKRIPPATNITCSYDENGTDPVASLHGDGPRGRGNRVGPWMALTPATSRSTAACFLQELSQLRDGEGQPDRRR